MRLSSLPELNALGNLEIQDLDQWRSEIARMRFEFTGDSHRPGAVLSQARIG
jgi:hypothetical protein